jgi:hypothetical protein
LDGRLWFVAFGLLLFGMFYAYRITLRPFPAGKTWLSVVVGDAATDLGVSLALWLLTGDWRICLVPWAAHALTGLPVILAQAIKDRLQNDGADAATELISGEDRGGAAGLTGNGGEGEK